MRITKGFLRQKKLKNDEIIEIFAEPNKYKIIWICKQNSIASTIMEL